MKIHSIICALCVLVLAACSTPIENGDGTADQSLNHTDEGTMKESAHIGCQESEIDAQGTCVPANNTNSNMLSQNHTVTVQELNEPVQGYLARPNDDHVYPGVILIHEWWGLNEHIRTMARELAAQGYIVYAVDLYDGEVATQSAQAMKLVSQVRSNEELAVQKMQAAAEHLRALGAQKIGSFGWCFGGQQSLQISLASPMDATVIYYGQLETDAQKLSALNGPVLGIFGGQDTSITVESVRSFEQALTELNIVNSVHIYPDVGHAFANPSGNNFAADETKDAWEKTLAFLAKNLQ